MVDVKIVKLDLHRACRKVFLSFIECGVGHLYICHIEVVVFNIGKGCDDHVVVTLNDTFSDGA